MISGGDLIEYEINWLYLQKNVRKFILKMETKIANEKTINLLINNVKKQLLSLKICYIILNK